MIFKSLTDPYSPANEGSFRPIHLLTREGSVFHAREPAPIGFYYEIELRVYDLMWRCLAPHMPDRLSAGHFASVCGTFIGGIHPDTGRQYTIIEPQIGGWGANRGSDGNSAIFCGFHGETYNCPAEINEARNGLIVDRMELNTEPGGEGKFTGGRGIVMDYRVRADNGFLTAGYTRSKFPAWALDGGSEGSPNYVKVIRTDGSHGGLFLRLRSHHQFGRRDPRHHRQWRRHRRPEGARPKAVAEDIRNGLITPERAKEVYGYGG